MLSPYKSVHLEKWSVLDGKPLQGPTWNNRETYFIYYSCVSNCVPYTFSIELNVGFNYIYNINIYLFIYLLTCYVF